jgi:hypothetical protein
MLPLVARSIPSLRNWGATSAAPFERKPSSLSWTAFGIISRLSRTYLASSWRNGPVDNLYCSQDRSQYLRPANRRTSSGQEEAARGACPPRPMYVAVVVDDILDSTDSSFNLSDVQGTTEDDVERLDWDAVCADYPQARSANETGASSHLPGPCLFCHELTTYPHQIYGH